MPFSANSLPVVAVLVALCTSLEAGSIHFTHSKAQLDAAADVRIYERVERMRELAPTKFDHIHPLAGRMLSNERVYEKLLRQWEDHPARFELAHPCLWHVLHGKMLYRRDHPLFPAVVPSGELPPQVQNYSPPDVGDPGDHGQGGPGGGIHPGSVPEPSSAVISLSGLILASLALARRRAYRWLKPRYPGGASSS
jgi:hypothetical protein